MRYTVSGELNGIWQFLHAKTASEAASLADGLHLKGVFPVHMKRDGALIESPEDLEKMIQEEADA